jgi:hypothetical protein
VEEFDEATAAIFRGKEVVNGVVINGVKDSTVSFPESVTIEEDMWYGPGGVTMGADCVVSS